MTHDEMIRALVAERFGRPTPPPAKREPISGVALAELIAELGHHEEQEGVA